MKRTLLFLVALGFFSSSAVTAQEGIRFGGGTTLQVGQSQEAAIAALRRSFIAEPVAPTASATPLSSPKAQTPVPRRDRSTWVVYEKQEPSYLRGSVSFAEGKLESASKDWLLAESPGTSSDIVAAIYGLFTELAAERLPSCIIDTDLQAGPGLEVKTAMVSCGHKTVRISIAQSAGKEATINVREEIR